MPRVAGKRPASEADAADLFRRGGPKAIRVASVGDAAGAATADARLADDDDDSHLAKLGYSCGPRLFLHPEETLFLVETQRLVLFASETGEGAARPMSVAPTSVSPERSVVWPPWHSASQPSASRRLW